jgi:hypothetical protein
MGTFSMRHLIFGDCLRLAEAGAMARRRRRPGTFSMRHLIFGDCLRATPLRWFFSKKTWKTEDRPPGFLKTHQTREP